MKGNRVGAVLGGRSAEPVNSLFDGKGFIWKLEELSAAAVFCIEAEKAVVVVILGEGMTVIHFLQLIEWIVDEKSSFCDLRQPSVDEILADCGVFRIVLVMGGNSSFRVQHILSADLTVVADILTQCEMVQIECQVYEILYILAVKFGDPNEKLVVFECVEALHAFAEIVEFVQIGKAVFQHGEFLRPVDLRHKGGLSGVPSFDSVDLTKLCKQFALSDREADVNLVIGVFDSDFDHGAHSFRRK